MFSQLFKDSITQSDAYYYRINRVKREEVVDDNSREVNEYDRFGHQLTQVHYLNGELFWRNVDVYNRYGNQISGVHKFYDDNETLGNTYTTTNQYEPLDHNLGQRLVHTDMRSSSASGSESHYEYAYSYKGGLVDIEARFFDNVCTEKVYYTYNASGKPQQYLIIEYKSTGPDTIIRTYTYDDLGRESNWAETSHGVLLSDHRTEYNAEGRVSKYSSITYEPMLSIVFEHFYLKNGLMSHVTTTYNGAPSTARYKYAYY
jgi:hypothetical protein